MQESNSQSVFLGHSIIWKPREGLIVLTAGTFFPKGTLPSFKLIPLHLVDCKGNAQGLYDNYDISLSFLFSRFNNLSFLNFSL